MSQVTGMEAINEKIDAIVGEFNDWPNDAGVSFFGFC